jgi:RNA polymerase sigma factor (TIGR02999 family)
MAPRLVFKGEFSIGKKGRMSAKTPQPVTVLLEQWKAGDPDALAELIPLLYDELHELAGHYLRMERRDHTLQSTALINEAYIRLAGQESQGIENRAHFLGVAAHVMRQVLVDHARARRAAKRDGGARIELRDEDHPLLSSDVDTIALDEAMNKLGELDVELCRIAEMRLFGGLTVEESATAIGMSPATVKREWAAAKAWLSRELGAGA